MITKSLLFARLTLVGLLVSATHTAVSAGTRDDAAGDNLITVVNPAVATKLADRVPLAPRLGTLEGKTIYLVDDNWGGMGENGILHEEMQTWFSRNMPGVKIVRKIKRGNFVTDDPALWKEIADNKGDGVIIGVAG